MLLLEGTCMALHYACHCTIKISLSSILFLCERQRWHTQKPRDSHGLSGEPAYRLQSWLKRVEDLSSVHFCLRLTEWRQLQTVSHVKVSKLLKWVIECCPLLRTCDSLSCAGLKGARWSFLSTKVIFTFSASHENELCESLSSNKLAECIFSLTKHVRTQNIKHFKSSIVFESQSASQFKRSMFNQKSCIHAERKAQW